MIQTKQCTHGVVGCTEFVKIATTWQGLDWRVVDSYLEVLVPQYFSSNREWKDYLLKKWVNILLLLLCSTIHGHLLW